MFWNVIVFIAFNIDDDLDILNVLGNIYANSVLEELRILKEIKHDKFKNILNVQRDFENNIIYIYIK